MLPQALKELKDKTAGSLQCVCGPRGDFKLYGHDKIVIYL
jgi:hypothetical protein